MGMTRFIPGVLMTLLLILQPSTASEYMLDKFGNANEDSTINMPVKRTITGR